MIDKLATLIPDGTYHVFNRANGEERLFRNHENYQYFLKKYKEYIAPLADTFCYCLLPNHFHFVIRIKPEPALLDHMYIFATRKRAGKKARSMAAATATSTATRTGLKTLSELRALRELQALQMLPPALRQKKISEWLSQQFSHLCNGYTQAINKRYKRKGGLFMRPFKRILVNDINYRYNLVKYVHQNPMDAQLSEDLHSWPYSSYSSIIQNDNSFIKAAEILSWYDGLQNFKDAQRGDSSFDPWKEL